MAYIKKILPSLDNGELFVFTICSSIWLISVFVCFNWIEEYQSLLTGLLVLNAALFTIWAMWLIEDQKRENKNKVARAMLGHALANICDYARKSLEHLSHYKDEYAKYDPTKPIPDLPSEQTFVWLCNAIECASPATNIGKCIANLINELQVHDSRLSARDITYHWAITLQAQCVVFYAYTELLFNYARGESENCEILSIEEINSATHGITNDTAFYPFAAHFLEAYKKLKVMYSTTSPQ